MEKSYRAELTACLGDPVDGNPTGVMEEAAFAAKKLNWRYLTIQVKKGDLPPAFSGLKAMGFRGFNLTMPHKLDIIPMLDELTEAASIIGAVNTIHFTDDGRAIGYNTDYYGVLALMAENNTDIKGKTALILGAGGAARAFIAAIRDSGASRIYVASRSAVAGDTYLDCPMISYDALEHGFHANLVVNCTPVGMWPQVDVSPLSKETLEKLGASYALDAIYNPDETLFLKHAKALGMTAANGMTMLWEQAVKAQDIWNGQTPE